MTEIRCLTVLQPWASLIAIGAKPFEFRTDHTTKAARNFIGQRVGIHAGAQRAVMEDVWALITKLRLPKWKATGVLPHLALPFLKAVTAGDIVLPTSAVLCTGVLGVPIRDHELARDLRIGPDDPAYEEFIEQMTDDQHTNWGLPIIEVRRLEPIIPMSGNRGWWKWDVPADVQL